ncbi:MAG TPA: L-2-hydroxyglutarate oxidase, partial [bacterium]|nr:L-2-hydroxyglutarate oxidase [bacterium]
MPIQQYDIVVIGGGIVGLATAKALTERFNLNLRVLEAEEKLATHQTGHNSGVIHSGLYYTPGSLKARTCTSGREKLYEFCRRYSIPHERCGKVVVAASEEELPRLDELERRGRANGLRGIYRVDGEALNQYEPHVSGIAGLVVEETGIVDFVAVADQFGEVIRENGGEISTNARVIGCETENTSIVLETTSGTIHCRHLVNCAGLYSDRVARMCGAEPDVKIVPFRGEYYELIPPKRSLVNFLIYPVPDPKFPFLGVHFTRLIDGSVEAGPNAVLAFQREGYSKWSFSLKDSLDTLTYKGFWKLAGKFWKTGFGEMYRSYSKKAFLRSLQRLIPEIQPE